VTWQAGACDVELRDALGATYQFAPEAADQAAKALRDAAHACLDRPSGTQGTLYVEAEVGKEGALTDVVVSPGGAVSTDVAECLTRSFGEARVPAPKEAGEVLLLFVVSACAPP